MGLKPAFEPELRLFGGLLGTRESRVIAGASGARFGLAFLGFEICHGSPVPRRLRPIACLGQVVGWLHAKGFGFDDNHSTAVLRLALHARLGIALTIAEPVSALLNGRAELPMTRSVFVYGESNGQQGGIYRTSPVPGVLELALVLAWR